MAPQGAKANLAEAFSILELNEVRIVQLFRDDPVADECHRDARSTSSKSRIKRFVLALETLRNFKLQD
jgi:hypothetical protein